MESKNVYMQLIDFLKEIIPEAGWVHAEIQVEIQPGFLQMRGKASYAEKIVSLKTKFNQGIKSSVFWLHTATSDKRNKWNKMQFELKPDDSYEVQFIWDQDWQDKVDQKNAEIASRNHEYKIPRWHWED